MSRQACVRVRRRVRFRVRARERDLRAALVVSAADAAHEVARDQLGRAVAQRRVRLGRVRARLGFGLGLGVGFRVRARAYPEPDLDRNVLRRAVGEEP